METTAGYRYTKFFVLANGYRRNLELHFQVMATGNAHIALTASPIAQNPLYEIVIGASGNNFTGEATIAIKVGLESQCDSVCGRTQKGKRWIFVLLFTVFPRNCSHFFSCVFR